ncbi:MAG: hypothetical protein JWM07_804 [Candidatus Saccharibacteria bacterium]|nr:hypothetical protein [Candidatus Saccharibacteria bacterium]
MPDNGDYLFTSIGFSSNEEPILLLQKDESFFSFNPINQSLTLTFDTSQRYCVGWKDITAGGQFVCPNKQMVPSKFEQCAGCQKRTGFNPAFYHATSVSAQQETRNTEPHILYLAHFGPGVIKVGISHAKRGNARLLEQGARSAMILDTLSSAHVARQYEAKIAALPNIAETIQLRKKIDLMMRPYDEAAATQELLTTKAIIESHINTTFTSQHIQTFNSHYFPNGPVNIADAHATTGQLMLAGKAIGLMGSVLFCEQNENIFYSPLKQYAGYAVSISDSITPITAPARQTSLF